MPPPDTLSNLIEKFSNDMANVADTVKNTLRTTKPVNFGNPVEYAMSQNAHAQNAMGAMREITGRDISKLDHDHVKQAFQDAVSSAIQVAQRGEPGQKQPAVVARNQPGNAAPAARPAIGLAQDREQSKQASAQHTPLEAFQNTVQRIDSNTARSVADIDTLVKDEKTPGTTPAQWDRDVRKILNDLNEEQKINYVDADLDKARHGVMQAAIGDLEALRKSQNPQMINKAIGDLEDVARGDFVQAAEKAKKNNAADALKAIDELGGKNLRSELDTVHSRLNGRDLTWANIGSTGFSVVGSDFRAALDKAVKVTEGLPITGGQTPAGSPQAPNIPAAPGGGPGRGTPPPGRHWLLGRHWVSV